MYNLEGERNKPRSFTGCTDEQWEKFTKIVRLKLGGGKRSMFLTTIIQKTVEGYQWEFEQQSAIEDQANHAIGDTFTFFGIKIPIKKSVENI